MSLALKRQANRTTLESTETAGYPIVPIGDSIRSNVTEEVNEAGERVRRIGYPFIRFQIVHPVVAGRPRSSSTIQDVYVALLFLYKNANFPSDGVVYFSRHQLLRLLGWLSSSSTDGGQKIVKPSGRHYRQLQHALQYLSNVKLINDDHSVDQVGPDGQRFRGYQEFPILQYTRIVSAPTGPRSEHRSVPAQSMVQFSAPFLEMIAKKENLASMDWDLYLALPAGTPRHLLRLFSWMIHQGINRIRLREVFQRIGSTQQEYRVARARQILGEAHSVLVARGVLLEEPNYEKIGDEYWIEYKFSDLDSLLWEEELLVWQAVSYGVAPAVARELAIAQRAQFERVLAAATLGIIRPRRSLASMLVHYTRHEHEIIDPKQALSGVAQLQIELNTSDTDYITWCANERAARLENQEKINANDVRLEIQAQNRHRGNPRPDWLIEGLTAMRLNEALGIESLEVYQQRRALERGSKEEFSHTILE